MGPRILIVDDHPIVRTGLKMILAEHDYTNLFEAGNGIEALALATEVVPDVVILDIGLPGMRGIDLGTELLRRHPDTKVIFLTIHREEEYVQQALSIGASGYVLKDCMETEVITAIQTVQRGRTYLTPLISTEVMSTYATKASGSHSTSPFHQLTNREREVLTLLSEGRTNKEIADVLFISPRTVEHHRQHLMKKLRVRSIPELMRLAIRKKLVEI